MPAVSGQRTFMAYSTTIPSLLGTHRMNQLIASNDTLGLYFMQGKDRGEDRSYWLVGEPGAFGELGIYSYVLAVFGYTGMIQSVSAIENGRRTELLKRPNAFGNFRNTSGIETSRLVDTIYGKMKGIAPNNAGTFSWDSRRLSERFGRMNRLVREDIVPEYNDTMVAAKVSDGCRRGCGYCSYPNMPFRLYSMDEIAANFSEARAIEQEYHGNEIWKMDEGFISSSDLLWHLHGGADPAEIARRFRGTFPEVVKLYAFFGVPTVNHTADAYLRQLAQAGLDSPLIGIETFHDAASRLVGKPETYEQKVNAIRKLRGAGFRKIKIIVQVGMFGEGFYLGNRFVSGRDELDRTADVLSDIISPFSTQFKVLVSGNIPGVRAGEDSLDALFDKGVAVPYTYPERLDEDIRYLLGRLMESEIDVYGVVDQNYEVALENIIRSGVRA